MTIDPVDHAVISQGIIAAAREMGSKLVRSAYSTVVREAADASAALLDRDGRIVAQAEMIPMQLGSMTATWQACVDHHPVEDLVEGDFYLSNDPYNGAQHIPDVFIFQPVFFEGRVIAFAASVAHHLEFGGAAAGIVADATDLYQEGLRLPPARWNLKRDWFGGPLQRLIAKNIRVPDLTLGDLNAQFAANGVGAGRLKDLAAKYGVATLEASMAELIAYSERRVRAAIAEIPDGTWHGEDAIDDDGVHDEPLIIRAAVTVKGDTIHVDFAGTSDQVARNLNSPLSSTHSAAFTPIKAALTSADIPFNHGMTQPVTLSVPYVSLLNPKPPAPVHARMLACYRVFNAVMKALSQAVPEKVIACGFDTTTALSMTSFDGERYRVVTEVLGGGYGGSRHLDGVSAVGGPLANCTNTPVEALDLDYDFFRLHEYSLRPDSGGAGRTRGGLGYTRIYEILKPGSTLTMYADRFKLAPKGLFGGNQGQCARCTVERAGIVIDVAPKGITPLETGDIITIMTGGGAGYGDPGEREATLISEDIADGFVTPEAARRDYRWGEAAE
ncbi:MAG: hydantoinase B/oxoprolinase family protein [Alphaproteobacteria bacterium]|nr:hydantoinase B/oxoprolinase family protein [Alphaproteobacteria bacterium]